MNRPGSISITVCVVLLVLMLGGCGADVVSGSWSGHLYPPASDSDDSYQTALASQASLSCEIERVGRKKWKATINVATGDSALSSVELIGRREGGVTVFEGFVNVGGSGGMGGEKIFWHGELKADRFEGEYAGAAASGRFRLSRVESEESADPE